jgi:hypothetical protein
MGPLNPYGHIQIKGDGHQNRYVLNFYAQFYPGHHFSHQMISPNDANGLINV